MPHGLFLEIILQLRLQPETIGLLSETTWSDWGDNAQAILVSRDEPGFVRRPPLSIFDPHQTRLGESIRKPRPIRRHAVTCRRIKGARLAGQRLITDSKGNVAYDEVLADHSGCETVLERWTRPAPHFREDTDVELCNGAYCSQRLDAPAKFVEGTTLSLLSAEPSNYGSWLFRIIPKLTIAGRVGLLDYQVACWCPPALTELLEIFGVADDRIIRVNTRQNYEFEDLFVPSSLNPEAYLNEATLQFVRSTLKRHGIEQTPSRKLYLSRRSHAIRRNHRNVRWFIDEDQLIDQLASAGFEIIEPESLSILNQIKLFAEAAVVVGASGAAMFNTIFSPPGCLIVDIEAFPYWLHAHTNYFASCGHNYVIAFGLSDETDPDGPHKRWTIDVRGLMDIIDEFFGSKVGELPSDIQ